MSHKEISRREEKHTQVFTTVEFTFNDGETKEVEIPHAFDADEATIQIGIENRGKSEEIEHEKEKGN